MLRADNYSSMITRLYILFLGLLMTLFIGVGIAAFYQSAKAPEYPAAKTPAATSDSPVDAATQAENDKFQREERAYEANLKTYNRNVSILSLAGAIILVALGLTLLKSTSIINDSLLLGGVFTLIYSIVRGFGSGDDVFRFLLVSISLVIALVLGYIKLIKPLASTKKSHKH
jgi:hypothetical protein